MEQAYELLKKHFGYSEFRTGQKDIIQHILNGQDTLAIMPTGAGKSICYQIPAMIFPGTTIVISPLISLMKDQVDNLNQVGIPGAFINSSLSNNEYSQTIQNASLGMYKIIYVAPERLDSEDFKHLLSTIQISMVAIDEAHCVSQWGHDFRPSYTQIADIILNMKIRPIVTAFTATATEIVKNDIINILHLNNVFTLTTGFDRPNLTFKVETPVSKRDFVFNYIFKKKNTSGIIYCLTRKLVDDLYEDLNSKNYKVSKYHGGMTEKQRTENQNDFVFDRTDLMVATNAFGMGIDKSNIRFVLHYNMPQDLESYYQEAGRGGRDGGQAECILLFNRSDIITNKFLIEQGSLNFDHTNEYKKLNDIIDFCNTDKCLRKYILEYFGETVTFDYCNNCSNCDSDIETTNITLDAQKIFSCIKRMHERFGSGIVTDVLKGSNTSKIRTMGFNELSTYGIMSDYSKDTIRDLISFLIAENYINSVGDQYPILSLAPSAMDVLFSGRQVFIKRKIEKININTKNYDTYTDKNIDHTLFEILLNLRREIAKTQNVPPFMIFPDTTLKQMASSYPINSESMLLISGVGNVKIKAYGEKFINTIKKYVEENNIQINEFTEQFNKTKISSLKNSTSSKDSTHIISYNLFKDGKSIDEIVNIRKLTRTTIENHLIKCLNEGLEVDLSKEIHSEFKDVILDAISKNGTERLRPLKDLLPDEITYFDIHYYIWYFEKKIHT